MGWDAVVGAFSKAIRDVRTGRMPARQWGTGGALEGGILSVPDRWG